MSHWKIHTSAALAQTSAALTQHGPLSTVAQLGSTEVKLASNPSNRSQIGLIGRNISNIHMFRLRILSEMDIQNYLRSNQVIKSHQRSNMSKTSQIGLFGPMVYNIQMFWPRIWSTIQIQCYFRSNQVIQSHQKLSSNYHSTYFGKRQSSELINF